MDKLFPSHIRLGDGILGNELVPLYVSIVRVVSCSLPYREAHVPWEGRGRGARFNYLHREHEMRVVDRKILR